MSYTDSFKKIPEGFNPDKLLKLESTPKYFIPSLEDLHVGYEIQSHEWSCDEAGDPELNYDRWVTEKLTKEHLNTILQYNINISHSIRVLYLNAEQIQKEGWKEILHDNMIGVRGFEKGNYFMIVNFDSQTPIPLLDFILRDPSIEERVGNPERFRFFCECKDINTLRHIEKLLKIK